MKIFWLANKVYYLCLDILIMGSVYSPKDLSKEYRKKISSNESIKDIIPQTNIDNSSEKKEEEEG